MALTPEERWERGADHHPESEKIGKFFRKNDPHGIWEFGGDGDNGEDMLYLLDCYFADRGDTWSGMNGEDNE